MFKGSIASGGERRLGFWKVCGAFCALVLFLRVSPAEAAITYTLNDTAHHVSATATFSVVTGGIQIVVTNTETNTANAGMAIGQLQFTVGGALGLPSAFTELKGVTTSNFSQTAAIDHLSPAKADHWMFKTSVSTVNLFTVDGNGMTGYGGKPNHLIAATGSTPNASLMNNHNPSFIGPVTFYLKVAIVPADLTAADITGVKFSFGTGSGDAAFTLQSASPPPQLPPGGTTPGVTAAAPEPGSLLLWGLLGLAGLVYSRRAAA